MVGYFSASLDPTQPDSYEARERKRRLAETLIQQGSSIAPVQHWTQGLARLAQALAGTLDERRLDEQEATSNKTALDAILGAYGAGGSTAAPGGTTPSLGPVASDGSASATVASSADLDAKARDFTNYLVQKKGMDPKVAAGIVGNAWQESSLNHGIVGDGGASIGLFQFNNKGEQPALRQWASANNRDINDPYAQLDFVVDRLQNQYKGVYDQMAAGPDHRAAASIFMRGYERPSERYAREANRIGYADRVLSLVRPQGGAPASAAINQAAPMQVASNAPGLGYAPSTGGASLSGAMPAPADDLTVRALQDYARRKNLQPPSPEMGPASPLQNVPVLPGSAPILPPGLSATNGPAGGAGLVNLDAPAPGAITAGPGPSPLRDTGDGSHNNPFLEGSPEARAAQKSALSTAGEQPGPRAYAPATRATAPAASGISDRSKQMLMIALNPQFSPAQRQVAASAFATMQAQDKPMVLQEGATLIKPDGKGGYMTVAGGGPKQSDAIRNYEYYANQERQAGRQPKPMDQWQIDQKRAGATTISIDQKGQGAMQQKAIDAFDTAVKAGADANRRITAYGQLAEAMQGFTPGATAEARVKAKSILKDMGIIEGADVPDAEAFKRVQRQLEIAATPKGQGQITENERVLIRDLIPQIGNSSEGVAKIVQQLKQLDDYDLKVAQIYRDNARKNGGVPNYLEVSDQIANLGPPMTDAQMAALKSLTSPKPQAPASGAPASSSAPRWRIVQ